ncbi:hypothetical protein PEC302107_36050 [Pectobacterium araliae]|nr:hypothetical protein PEC302107_36050 [Pectobacterium carotovorum subsp. carotovorum]
MSTKTNAAGLVVSGDKNPNWKGGKISKVCAVCGKQYQVKRANSSSRFCSLRCVGISQRGRPVNREPRRVLKICCGCGSTFSVFRSHGKRVKCCSMSCSNVMRSSLMKGDGNPNWSGGLSRLPYPWDFRETSKKVIERDGFVCQNPGCDGADERLTTHHINYNKQDCRQENLICLCSSCNSKANFGRREWQVFYESLMAKKLINSKNFERGWE